MIMYEYVSFELSGCAFNPVNPVMRAGGARDQPGVQRKGVRRKCCHQCHQCHHCQRCQ